ncbi:MAG TPA: sigma-70 family RNA polymerase sigma factor [Blastocatellia bacterium]|nr:sigma-70 family RNA polymerase sigma factor [Blastocatellia bacterium]
MYQEYHALQTSHNVTGLLIAWNNGDEAALEQLVPIVHDELHRLARRYMGGERLGHLLQPTALVNEAYIRLMGWKNVEWKNRAHFFGVSAKLMRGVLVDFARKRPRHAGHTAPHVSVDEACLVSERAGDDLVALDDALTSLAAIDERKSRIVELRYFGGLSNEEIAGVLHISTVTVIREWNKAKAWLYRELSSRP